MQHLDYESQTDTQRHPKVSAYESRAPIKERPLRKDRLAVGIELLQVDILIGQPLQPHCAEEGFDRLDQQDGLGETRVVETAPEVDARFDGDDIEGGDVKTQRVER